MSLPRKICLPAGKVGLGFKGSPATVTSVSEDCPVGDEVEMGAIVVQFSVEGECEYTGLKIPSGVLGKALKEYADSPDRVIYVWDADTKQQPDAPDKLPTGKNVVPGGTWWMRFREKDGDSVHMDDNKDQSFKHVPVYKEPGPDGRWLNKYGSQTRPGDEEYPYALPTVAARMDCTYKVWLPAGKVGVSLKGIPSIVTKIKDDSPLYGKVKHGQQVIECAVGGVIKLEGEALHSDSIGEFLNANSESDERTIKLTYAYDAEMEKIAQASKPKTAVAATSKAVAVAATSKAVAVAIAEPVEPEEPPATFDITLPAGITGLSFKGAPCKVSRVDAEGPLANSGVKIGQQVYGCKVGSKEILSGSDLKADQVGKFLRDYAQSPSDEPRIITLTEDQDAAFVREVERLRASIIILPIPNDTDPPQGAKSHGIWFYKEPGIEGRVLNKEGEPISFSFTVLNG